MLFPASHKPCSDPLSPSRSAGWPHRDPLLIKCLSPRSPGLMISSDSPGRARFGGSFLWWVYQGFPTAPQGFTVPFHHIIITLSIPRLNIQGHSKSIYQSHENNISKFKANVFGKSSCSPLVSSCGVLSYKTQVHHLSDLLTRVVALKCQVLAHV